QDGRQTLYTTSEGLSDSTIVSLAEDREKNLWIGTFLGGVCKFSDEKIVSFTKVEGLPNQISNWIVNGRGGRVYTSTPEDGIVEAFNGKISLVPGSRSAPFNTVNKRIFHDSRGDWWVGTDVGLFRFRGPDLQLRRGKKFTITDGIPESQVCDGPGIYEDPSGQIWVGLSDHDLYFFDHARKQAPFFQRIGLRDLWSEFVFRMISDRTGALWIGGFNEMARLVNGQFNGLESTEGLPETRPRAFFQDSRGWLWIGLRFRGVSVVKDPGNLPLRFLNYSTSDGLIS